MPAGRLAVGLGSVMWLSPVRRDGVDQEPSVMTDCWLSSFGMTEWARDISHGLSSPQLPKHKVQRAGVLGRAGWNQQSFASACCIVFLADPVSFCLGSWQGQ